MTKGKAGEPPGIWLKNAIQAQGKTLKEVSEMMGYVTPSKYDKHSQNKKKIGFDSLAELAHAFPTMNMRYVLTGEGSPIL
ncbi:hypothetical protein GCM10028807_32910 [Spirosoma daeguense]